MFSVKNEFLKVNFQKKTFRFRLKKKLIEKKIQQISEKLFIKFIQFIFFSDKYTLLFIKFLLYNLLKMFTGKL